MRYKDFIGSTSGHLVETVYGAKAFVPNPLPPRLDLARLAIPLGEAGAKIGELRGACRRLSNPYILIRPLQRLEAQTSSAMEGTFTTANELALTEAGVTRNPTTEAIEVANYIRALTFSIQKLDDLPLSGRLLKSAHALMLERVGQGRGQDKQPGEYARDQNMIGGTILENARFIPPPPKQSADAMSELEKYINREDKTQSHQLVDMALVHYQFETIHPFADGNGRLGRMLISLMAITENLLDKPVLYMSPELESQKDAYIDHMYRVSASGEWEEWIAFFLSVLARSCERTIRTIDHVLDLQNRYHDQVRAASRSNNISAVVDILFESPVIQPKDIVGQLGITDAAARNILRQLCDLGIVVEMTQFYPRVWVAGELLDMSRST